jgi:hypothetical protein
VIAVTATARDLADTQDFKGLSPFPQRLAASGTAVASSLVQEGV